MNEDPTKKLPDTFEARVLAALEDIKTSLGNLDERVQILEAKSYDTKPIWENALKEIADTCQEMRAGFELLRAENTELRTEIAGVRAEIREGFANSHIEVRRVERKIAVLADSLIEIRADLREFDARLLKLEPETTL